MPLPIHSLSKPELDPDKPMSNTADEPEFPVAPQPESWTFRASRATKGNFWFPTKLILDTNGVTYSKGKVFGQKLVTISYDKIGTVALETSLFYAKLVIEADTDHDISVSGLRKRDAKQIRKIVEEKKRG
jgi:hypothetical protein